MRCRHGPWCSGSILHQVMAVLGRDWESALSSGSGPERGPAEGLYMSLAIGLGLGLGLGPSLGLGLGLGLGWSHGLKHSLSRAPARSSSSTWCSADAIRAYAYGALPLSPNCSPRPRSWCPSQSYDWVMRHCIGLRRTRHWRTQQGDSCAAAQVWAVLGSYGYGWGPIDMAGVLPCRVLPCSHLDRSRGICCSLFKLS